MSKVVALLLGLIVSSPTWAEEMIKVAERDSICGTVEGYCYEWQVARDESLRFVASGHEDGGDWSFFRRSAEGRYTHLFSVYPAMQDAHRPGLLFWGYAWDITDIALATGSGPLRLLVNFDHDYQYDGNWEPDAWQRSVPYVLFVGNATQPNMQVEAQTFRPMSIDEVRSRAAVSHQTK